MQAKLVRYCPRCDKFTPHVRPPFPPPRRQGRLPYFLLVLIDLVVTGPVCLTCKDRAERAEQEVGPV